MIFIDRVRTEREVVKMVKMRKREREREAREDDKNEDERRCGISARVLLELSSTTKGAIRVNVREKEMRMPYFRRIL